MRLTPEEIARAISGHQFAAAFPYLADDVSWTIIGGEAIVGRAAVIETCEQSAAYLADVASEFRQFRVLSGPDWVVIDSLAEYTPVDEAASLVASCDLYRFEADGLLSEITSYNIDLSVTPP